MTPEQFCYWLRGIFEIQTAGLDNNTKFVPKLTESQIDMIHRHLESCFHAKISMQGEPLVGPSPLADLCPMGTFPSIRPSEVIC